MKVFCNIFIAIGIVLLSELFLFNNIALAQTNTEVVQSGNKEIEADKAAIEKRLRAAEKRQARYDSMMRRAMIEKEQYEGKSQWSIMNYKVENGDTIFLGSLPTVFKFHKSTQYKNNKQWRQFRRLVWNFKKVYPYALEAKKIIREADSTLAMSNFSDSEREKYIDQYQKELFSKFEKPMRKLSVSQGRLLLKLIDRELGKTSFYIIREYRGKLSAGFWQTVAKIFGNDLKRPYDKFGEDRQVEDLVLLYNTGAFDALYYSMFSK